MSKLKVLLVYIVYPLAMGTYFRSALEHREDVDLRVAGIYTGSWIPWKGGMSLPIKYAKPPDYVLPLSLGSNEYNYEMIMAQIGDWKPDLVIQVDAGFHAKYKPSQGVVVTVGTDPHVLNDFYDVLVSIRTSFSICRMCIPSLKIYIYHMHIVNMTSIQKT